MRSLAPVVHMPGADVESKLAFAEFLLSSTDLQASARRAMDWLAAHSDVEQAIIAVHDQLTGQVLLVAEYGLSSTAIVDFVLSREDTAHPLVRAMSQREPTFFDATPSSFHAPLVAPFHAIPLRGDDDDRADGLLLAGTRGPDLNPEVAWLSRLLGRQIARLLSRATLADTRFGQERMLFTASSTRSPTRSC